MVISDCKISDLPHQPYQKIFANCKNLISGAGANRVVSGKFSKSRKQGMVLPKVKTW
ncbi:hypothetical protein MARINOS108_11180 [Marinoscillum sp. 108]|nr:hypothetical protein MARINOS108_11180 [Marinoscillum sp. 108]